MVENQNSEIRSQKSEGGRSKYLFFALLSAFCFLLSRLSFSQQPQTSDVTGTQPLDAVNAKYANGVAPGYWPTAGAGLTLNISAGTAFCGSPPAPVNYAGGTLTLIASQTNYVYLDPTASCAPASKTTGFVAGKIPIAKVVTSVSAITSITDERTSFASIGGAASAVDASLQPGADACAKISAANTTLTGGGVIDARAFRGAQSCASGFVVGGNGAPVSLLLSPNVKFTISGSVSFTATGWPAVTAGIVVTAHSSIYGGGTGYDATKIVCAINTTTDCVAVTYPDTTDNDRLNGAIVSGLNIQCSTTAGTPAGGTGCQDAFHTHGGRSWLVQNLVTSNAGRDGFVLAGDTSQFSEEFKVSNLRSQWNGRHGIRLDTSAGSDYIDHGSWEAVMVEDNGTVATPGNDLYAKVGTTANTGINHQTWISSHFEHANNTNFAPDSTLLDASASGGTGLFTRWTFIGHASERSFAGAGYDFNTTANLTSTNIGRWTFVGSFISGTSFFTTGLWNTAKFTDLIWLQDTNALFPEMNVGGTSTTPSTTDKFSVLGASGTWFSCGNFSTGTACSLMSSGGSGTNYNFAAFSGENNLYVNRPTGGIIRFKEGNGPDQVGVVSGGTLFNKLNTQSSTAGAVTFDVTQGNFQTITLTENTTAKVSNAAIVSTALITFDIVQNGTAAKTFTWPANVKGAGTIGTTLNGHNIQSFWAEANGNLYPISAMHINF